MQYKNVKKDKNKIKIKSGDEQHIDNTIEWMIETNNLVGLLD